MIAYPLHLFSLLRQVALVKKTSIMLLIQPLLSSLAGSLFMYLALGVMTAILPLDTGRVDGLLFLVIGGAGFYLVCVPLLMRGMFVKFLSFTRR